MFLSRMRFAFDLGDRAAREADHEQRPFQAMHLSDLSKMSPPTES